ncbi:SCO family protein [Bdellovibrio sp. HCB117]|uniref:SCO family protein n=1 Tax=Bdellovibrio sp. HCB117 TaxID=3394359 RepID=UPI0039B37254
MGMLLSASVLVLFSTARAYDGKPAPKVASEAPKELEGVGIDEKLGGKIDLSLKVKDDNGQEVTLGSFFDGKHPVIISPVYFSCPGLCNFHLNGLTDALKLMDKNWTVGKKYKILSMSFDSKETPDLAAKKKETYIKLYERPEAASGWHFVTADESAVQAITQSLGFKFKWDETAKEWAHASAAVIITPDGTISRYLPGIMFNPQDIKLALNEATEGKIGSIVDNLVLYCFKYDPHQSKYTLAAFNLMKVGGAVMVLVMVLWLLPFYIRSRRSKNKTAGR